ncbi:MAG: TolC family protein [Armatimonadetes bacterium]|nr:TolC family protein [Armatimonadota bacterium]
MLLVPRVRSAGCGRNRRWRALALAGCLFAVGRALSAKPAPPPTGAPRGAAPPAATPAPRTLALAESVQVALQHSRAIQIAEERLQRARAQVEEAKAPNRVQASLNANATRIDKVSTFFVPLPDGTAQEISLGELYSRNLQMSITKPIDISGALRATRNIAELGADSARLDADRTRDQTVLDVKNAYYGVLRAQAALGVAQATVASLAEHLRQVRLFFEQGVVAQFDVLRAEAQVANAQQGEIAARNGVALAKAALNNAMGIDVTTPLEVRAAEKVEIIHPAYRESVTTAYEQRPEVLQAAVTTELARRGVKLAHSSSLPTLGLGFNATHALDPAGLAPRKTQWSASAVVSYPLLDGGLARSRTRQAEADVDTARVAEEQTREGVALEVQQAILSLGEAAERMDAAEKNVAQAAEALRLAKLRYREGLSTALDVTDAQAVLTQAESNSVNARYDYLLGRARYERATGQGQ